MPWRLNVHVPGPVLREQWPLTDAAASRLDDEVYAGRLTRRGAVRVHRVAWTVADLRGVDRPGVDELDVALRLRSATPLLLASVRRCVGRARWSRRERSRRGRATGPGGCCPGSGSRATRG